MSFEEYMELVMGESCLSDRDRALLLAIKALADELRCK